MMGLLWPSTGESVFGIRVLLLWIGAAFDTCVYAQNLSSIKTQETEVGK